MVGCGLACLALPCGGLIGGADVLMCWAGVGVILRFNEVVVKWHIDLLLYERELTKFKTRAICTGAIG